MRIECTNCQAACCEKNQELVLNNEERDFLIAGGTELETTIAPSPNGTLITLDDHDGSYNECRSIPPGYGQYKLMERCGYTKEEGGWVKCGAKKDPRRPQVCGNLVVGSGKCQDVRKIRGVDK